MHRRSGFTYIEVLVTLCLVAILFIPMMQLFSQAMGATSISRDLITAVGLARWEMERVKNLGVSTQRVKDAGNTVWPPKEEPPLDLNGRKWRIERTLKLESNPLEITVEVFLEGENKPVAQMATMITDSTWVQGGEQPPK